MRETEYLVTGTEMRAYDTYTIEKIGIPAMVLMERAALAVRECVMERLSQGGNGRDGTVLCVCGTGNNGGDGLCLARLLADEEFWKLRHGVYLSDPQDHREQPTSAWLFNSIANRHADMVDAMPTSTCLAREKEDVEDASMLSKIVPAICER